MADWYLELAEAVRGGSNEVNGVNGWGKWQIGLRAFPGLGGEAVHGKF